MIKVFPILLNKLEKEGKINNFRRTNNNQIALDIEKDEVQQLIDPEKTCGSQVQNNLWKILIIFTNLREDRCDEYVYEPC